MIEEGEVREREVREIVDEVLEVVKRDALKEGEEEDVIDTFLDVVREDLVRYWVEEWSEESGE